MGHFVLKISSLILCKTNLFSADTHKGPAGIQVFNIFYFEGISPNAFQVVSNLQMYFRRENPE